MPNVPEDTPDPIEPKPIEPKPIEPVPAEIPVITTEPEARPEMPKNYYFDNYKVEALLTEYVKNGCTDVRLRDEIMSNAGELIRQIIRTHNLQNIYPGRDEAAFGDLFQIAWCVPPSTTVFSDRGIMPISNVEIGTRLFGVDGYNTVVAKSKRDDVEIKKFTINSGYSISCTNEHPILALRENGYGWVKADDIKIGDLLAVAAGASGFGDDAIGFEYYPKTVGGTTKFWDPPSHFTSDLAYIIGMIISEGSIQMSRITIYNNDVEVGDRLMNNQLIGVRHEVVRGNEHRYVINSTRFVEFVNNLNCGTDAYDKQIPPLLMRCSRQISAALLRGMFDGDGHSNAMHGGVGYTSVSKTLIDQLRMLLLNFGITTRVSVIPPRVTRFVKKGREYFSEGVTSYQLLMSTANSRRFFSTIGFGIERKQKNALRLTDDQWDQRLPVVADVIKVKARHKITNYALKKVGIHNPHCVLKRTKLSTSTLNKVLTAMAVCEPQIINDEQYSRLMALSDTRYEWLPVTKITPGRSDVINVQTNGTNSYVADGVVTHNCQLEKVLYKFDYGPGHTKVFNMWSQVARTVMLAHIKKESRDRRGKTALENHILTKPTTRPVLIERFLKEAREICKYNDEYLELLDHIEEIHETDDRAYEGLIGKLIKKSGRSRQKISNFLLFIRFRGVEFSDSPMNDQVTQRPLPNWEHNDE